MEASGPLPRWQKNMYRCADGMDIACRQGTTMLNKISQRRLPVNGIQSIANDLLAVVSGTVLKRNMTEVIFGGPVRTYALPPTTVTICNSRLCQIQQLPEDIRGTLFPELNARKTGTSRERL